MREVLDEFQLLVIHATEPDRRDHDLRQNLKDIDIAPAKCGFTPAFYVQHPDNAMGGAWGDIWIQQGHSQLRFCVSEGSGKDWRKRGIVDIENNQWRLGLQNPVDDSRFDLKGLVAGHWRGLPFLADKRAIWLEIPAIVHEP